jgi:hypothetical protein
MSPSSEEPSFLLRMILDKLDAIDKKIDGHSEKLVSHEVRLGAVEKNIESAWKTKLAFAAAVVGAVAGPVVSLVIK